MILSAFPGILGRILSTYGILMLIWFILNIIANWKILSKAGQGGWQSFIPVWNTIARYGVSWRRSTGFLVAVVAPIAMSILSRNGELPQWLALVLLGIGIIAAICVIIEKFKLARAYGYGFFFGLGLLFLEPLFIMILAFGHSRYTGSR